MCCNLQSRILPGGSDQAGQHVSAIPRHACRYTGRADAQASKTVTLGCLTIALESSGHSIEFGLLENVIFCLLRPVSTCLNCNGRPQAQPSALSKLLPVPETCVGRSGILGLSRRATSDDIQICFKRTPPSMQDDMSWAGTTCRTDGRTDGDP